MRTPRDFADPCDPPPASALVLDGRLLIEAQLERERKRRVLDAWQRVDARGVMEVAIGLALFSVFLWAC